MGKNEEDPLDDPALFRMRSSNGMDNSDDSIQPADHKSKSNNHGIEGMTTGSEDIDDPQLDDNPEESTGSSIQLVCNFFIILRDTNTCSKPQGPIILDETPSTSTCSVRHILAILGNANISPNVP